MEIQNQTEKKIAAAVYEYQADRDGKWSETFLDFESGTAEIAALTDWDIMLSNLYVKRVLWHLLKCKNDKLAKESMFAFAVSCRAVYELCFIGISKHSNSLKQKIKGFDRIASCAIKGGTNYA